MTTGTQPLRQTLQRTAPYLLVAATALLIYETYLLQKSFLALYQIYQNITQNAGPNGPTVHAQMWFFSEVSGEIGLILRFAGAVFFVAFAAALLTKKPALAFLKRAVLLEAVQYLFLIPFISQWVIFSGRSATLTIISFSLQIILVTPTLLVFYLRLRGPQINQTAALKAVVVAALAFMFAMWVKHFLFNLYALPIDLSDPSLVAGLVNSTVPWLVSALLLTYAFTPIIRGKSTSLNLKVIGASMFIAGIYFAVYGALAAVNSTYESFIFLTELWMASLLIVGAGFVLQSNAPK